MKYYKIKEETLTDIANAVREKMGTTDLYTPSGMANAIRNLETGIKWNIAYGDTAPAEESALWVKCAEPLAAEVKTSLETGDEEMRMGVASLSENMCSIASASVGGKVYLFGGRVGDSPRNTIKCFDPETKEITTLATTLMTAAWSIGAAAVGTKVYLFGGQVEPLYSTNRIEVFDTQTNAITILDTVLPQSASGLAVAAVEKNIYLFGGYMPGSNRGFDTIQVFNTETGVLTQHSLTLPSTAWFVSAAVKGKKVYLLGGRKDIDNCLDSILVFDTKLNTLERLSERLPITNGGAATAVIGTDIFMFGGYNGIDRDEIIKFSMETQRSETLDMSLPYAAGQIAGASVGNKIYLFGGWGESMLSTVHEFVAGMDLTADHVLLDSSAMNYKFHILPSLEIGIANVYRGNDDGVAEKVPAALYKDGVWLEI